jgi:hypothetical protein
VSAEVELLREAAKTMRERASAANTTEARRPYSDPNLTPVPEAEWGGLVDNYLGGVIGTHCASWHPAVALAVADWLYDEAFDAGRRVPVYVEPPALAVARTYLGRES